MPNQKESGRLNATLDPKDLTPNKKSTLIDKKTSTDKSMRRTATRPFTQMSRQSADDNGETGGLIGVSGDGFKLDLRDEFTQTAKLERLKARY